jgi:EAL domain-containing protein (putative c-di-GMP-specific phosphodiesterase class I)
VRQFPVDSLKIDKAFVDGVLSNPRDSSIVSGVVHLARSLQTGLVVEGIEDRDQLAVLIDLGCDYGQGHLFGAAASADEVLTAGGFGLAPSPLIDHDASGA